MKKFRVLIGADICKQILLYLISCNFVQCNIEPNRVRPGFLYIATLEDSTEIYFTFFYF
jgi:hypothetical protein